MNDTEIQEIMQMSFEELATLSKTKKGLAEIITCAIHIGQNLERVKVNNEYNKIFKGYSEVVITN